MEIKIDEEKLESTINEKIDRAIENALTGYSVQAAISDKMTAEVATGIIGEALSDALKGLDTGRLTQAISENIQRAMVSAVTHMIYDGLTSLLLTLRKIPDYDRDRYKTEHDEIMAMLRQEKKADKAKAVCVEQGEDKGVMKDASS